MRGSEVATAYVTLLPSMNGFSKAMSKEMGGMGDSASRSWSQRFGAGLTKWAKRGVIAGGLAVGGFLGGAIKSGIDRTMRIEDAEAKLKGLKFSGSEVEGIMVDVLGSVKGTAFGLDEAADAAAGAIASGIKPGKELTAYLSLVGDAATQAGTDFNSMAQIFGKVQGTGKLTMMEINQLAANGLYVLPMLADEYGVTQEAMREMVSKGEVDAKTFQRVIDENIGGAAQKSGETTRGALKNMGAAYARFGQQLISGVYPLIRPLAGLMTDWLDYAAEHVGPLMEKLAGWIARAFEPVPAIFASLRDGVVGLYDLLVKGDFTSAFRNAFGAEEDSGLVAFLRAAREGFLWIRDTGLQVFRDLSAWVIENKSIFLGIAAGVATFIGALIAGAGVAATAAKAIGLVTGATRLLSGAFTLLAAHPVIFAIAALAAGFVYLWTTNEDFRAAVITAWDQIKTFAVDAWENTIQPAIGRFWDFVSGTLIPGVLSLWNDVFWPVFRDIGEIVTSAWQDKIQPALSAVWDAIDTHLIPTIVNLWENVVKPVFAFIGETIVAAWENFIGPALKALISFILDVLVPNILWLWSDVILPTFTKIGEIVVAVWEGMIQPALTRLRDFIFGVVAPVVLWLWENVVVPAFEGIAAIIRWAWENVIQPVFNWLVDAILADLIPMMEEFWTTVDNVWDWVGAAIKFAWNNVIKPTFDLLWGFITDTLMPAFSNLWSLAEDVWDGIGNAVEWAWKNLISPAFNAVKDGVNLVVRAFGGAIEAIGNAWEFMKRFLSRPIVAVLNFVNDNLIGGLNKVLGWISNDLKIGTITIPTFLEPGSVSLPANLKGISGGVGGGGGGGGSAVFAASGGILPGYSPGKDDHFFHGSKFDLALAGGEAIMRPEWTRAVGSGFVNDMNRAAREGGVAGVRKALGFAKGGVLDPDDHSGHGVDAFVGASGSATGTAVGGGGFLSFIKNPLAYVRNIFSGGIEALTSNPFYKFLTGLPGKVLSKVVDKLKSMLFGSGEDGTTPNLPEGRLQPVSGGMHWRSIWQLARMLVPNARMTSNYRPGAITASGYRSYHGLGRAVDIASPNMTAGIRNLAATGIPWSELYYSPVGFMRRGRWVPRSQVAASTIRNHYDHIHAAYAKGGIFAQMQGLTGKVHSGLYDNGGYLPPGLSIVANKTGKPEPVLTDSQWDSLKGSGSGGDTYHLYGVPMDSAGEVAATINYEVRRTRRGKYARH